MRVDRRNDEDDEDDDDGDGEEAAPKKKCKFDARSCDASNEELYQRLMEIDPERARTLHPNDRRKITRYDPVAFILIYVVRRSPLIGICHCMNRDTPKGRDIG